MQMHELIDREDPKCLYCNSECDLSLDGNGIGLVSYEIQMLKCRKCGEQFEIHETSHGNASMYKAFVFTCKNLVVFNEYGSGFRIGDTDLLWSKDVSARAWKTPDDPVWIVPFEVDFSDKKKLYKKLKTYLVFS